MAERYPPGHHQIYYKASAFQEGLSVSVKMLNPDDTWSGETLLVDVGNGLYRFEMHFNQYGTWVGLFSENSVCMLSQNFFVRRERSSGMNSNVLNG